MGRRAETGDGAGIRGNLRLDQDDLQVMFGGHVRKESKLRSN
jgi:hypothetical protein